VLCHSEPERQHCSQRLAGTPGGPAALTRYLRALGDPITRLDRNEPTLNEVAIGDVRDTTTPLAMLQTMQKLVLGESLSASSRAWLQRWLIETSTGDKRLRAGPRAGRWTRRALPAAVVLPTMWPCFGRQAPAVTAGQCW
jgi:beta-lactamase class A